jgi:dienelactone hydrolase
MPRLDVTIKTRDGMFPASVFPPADKLGLWPGVIFFMDGLGIRPVMWEMGQRLADGGYLVLLPDLYYRLGSYPLKAPFRARPKRSLRICQQRFSPRIVHHCRKVISSATTYLQMRPLGRAFR